MAKKLFLSHKKIKIIKGVAEIMGMSFEEAREFCETFKMGMMDIQQSKEEMWKEKQAASKEKEQQA